MNVAFLCDGHEIGNVPFMGLILARNPAMDLTGVDAEIASDSVLPARPMKGLAKQA